MSKMRRTGFTVVLWTVFVACGGNGAGGVMGEPGDRSDVDRVVEIETTNALEFDPATIDVDAGETIEFQISNVADVEHEFVLGAMHEHSEGMQHGGDPGATGTMEPGGAATIVWTFPEAGEATFACYIDNHDQAGMTGTIKISD